MESCRYPRPICQPLASLSQTTITHSICANGSIVSCSIISMYARVARKLSLLIQRRLMSLFHSKQLNMCRIQNVVHEISRVLSADRLFIISTPDKNLYSPPGKERNPYHCSEMAAEEFQTFLSSAFSTISLCGLRPHSAKWWSPIPPQAAKLRRRLWWKWNRQRVTPVPEVNRENPVDCILNGKSSWLELAVNWSAVRPLRRTRGWSPVFLIAVARKRN